MVGTITLTPGAGAPEIPHCFDCTCKDPTLTFTCAVHEPGVPETPPTTPTAQQTLYVPLFQYAKIIPRKGWEDNYQKALAGVIERLRAGYIIARIEGRTSPEGSLPQKAGFRGISALPRVALHKPGRTCRLRLIRPLAKRR